MGYYDAQRMVENFESLSLGGGGPGQGAEAADPSKLPRPLGDAFDGLLSTSTAAAQVDPGNCSPLNMRMTTNAIPGSASLKARWGGPLGVVVQPMADEMYGNQVPVINLGSTGIVRCRRCRTYINPFVQWTDSGRRYKCNVCSMLNEIPVEYYSSLDANGRRRDADDRPELSKGTVEYVAPAEYMVRPPMPPVYFFIIDVTQPAVASGMLATVCQGIKSSLEGLQGDGRTMIGFLTFDSTLHFYNLKSSLSQPQMVVVAEIDSPFVPLPDELLVNLKDSRTVIDALLDSLPNIFANNTVTDSCTGPALQAAFLVTSYVGGKLLLFQHSTPTLGVARTKARENLALYGTEREHTLRSPDDAFFKRYAAECSRVQLTLDIFAGTSQSVDLASWSAIARYTCGEVYYYPSFLAARDGPKLVAELHHNLTRPTAWEAVMRIRCSRGLKISSFHGHFFNRSTDLLALPTCDPDKAFCVQIAHEESVVPGPLGYVQCALLYTNSCGERRIRVHSLAIPIVNELHELYSAADVGGMAIMMAKLAVERTQQARLEDARQDLNSKLTTLLREFRVMHMSALRGQPKFIFPEPFKYLPLLILGTIKHQAFRGGGRDVAADERSALLHLVMGASPRLLMRMIHPLLFALHDTSGDWGKEVNGKVVLPPTLPLTMGFLQESGAYLVFNGRMAIMWLGRALNKQWMIDVFGQDVSGTNDVGAISPEPARPNPLSQRINAVLQALRANSNIYAQCFVFKQGSPLEVHMIPNFIEDRTPGSPSYLDFMQALHTSVMHMK